MEWKKAIAMDPDLYQKVAKIHSSVTVEHEGLLRCGLSQNQLDILWTWTSNLAETLGEFKYIAIPDLEKIRQDQLNLNMLGNLIQRPTLMK